MEFWTKVAVGAGAAVAALMLLGGRARAQARPVMRGLALGDSLVAHDTAVNVLRQQTRAPWDNVAEVGANTNAVLQQARESLQPGKYSHVVVLAGVNDGDRPSVWSKAHLAEIYRLAKESGAFVVAVTEMPFKGYAGWSETRQSRQLERYGWLVRYSGGGKPDRIVDAWLPMTDPNRPYYINPRYAAPDGLHLNGEGQRHLGALILQAIRR